MDVKLALKLSKAVHDRCHNVPHDIGITLEQIVREHENEQLNIHGVSVKRPDYDTIRAVIEDYDSLVQWKDGQKPEHCILPEHYGPLAKSILAAGASGAVDKTVCDGCEDIAGFYLGTTCPKCNQPFRQVK
jgi:hypothetical protein